MKTQKVLIIGAGGQLGSELTQALRHVYGAENVIASDIKHAQGALQDGRFEILDVLNQKALFEFIQKNGITQVYLLAAILSATGEKNPKFAWHLNMDGLIHVLDAAVEFKLDKVYWPSSIAAFGPTTPKNQTSQHTIMDPTTIYGRLLRIRHLSIQSWIRQPSMVLANLPESVGVSGTSRSMAWMLEVFATRD
jgi:nucleoside-diphosphate-sugar epimerase